MGQPTVPPLVEQWHDGGFLVSEANGHQSRDTITLAAGTPVLAGTVLGKITVAGSGDASIVSAGTATTPNKGNGTLNAGAPQPGVTSAGIYTCTLTGPNTFDLAGPGGLLDHGQAVGAQVSADGMPLKITAGSTPFVAGDVFTVTVLLPADVGAWRVWNPAAADGSNVAAGILFGSRDATRSPCNAVAITRAAEVNGSELIWSPQAAPADITAATAQLQALGVLIR
jgi:hypothetical protein